VQGDRTRFFSSGLDVVATCVQSLNLVDDTVLVAKIVSALRSNAIEHEQLTHVLSQIGCLVEFVPECVNQKTPDRRVRYGAQTVEVETTTSMQKLRTQKLQVELSEVHDRMRSDGFHMPYAVRFIKERNDDQYQSMIDALYILQEGQMIDTPPLWNVRRASTDSIDTVEFLNDPDWFKSDGPIISVESSMSQFRMQDGTGQSSARPDSIRWINSDRGYRNKLATKYADGQWFGILPFVLIWDVTQLPRAIGWAAKQGATLSNGAAEEISAVTFGSMHRSVDSFEALTIVYQTFHNASAKFALDEEWPLSIKGALELKLIGKIHLPPK